MLWCLMRIRMITAMYVHELNIDLLFGSLLKIYIMMGSYMKDLKKQQTCQNWGVGGSCPGQYGSWLNNI